MRSRSPMRLYLVSAALFLSARVAAAQNASQATPGGSSGHSERQPTNPWQQAIESVKNSVDILADTQGADVTLYLKDVGTKIRQAWYSSIPMSAQQMHGKVVIEFAIQRDGSLARMKLIESGGSIVLSRPAWGAITSSAPFEKLPGSYKSPYLWLRVPFYYNESPNDESGASGSSPALVNPAIFINPVRHAVLMQAAADQNMPQFPEKAIERKIDGIVRLTGVVEEDGKIKHLKAVEGDHELAKASLHAIRNWRFVPAEMGGMKLEDHVRIRVEFRLQGEQVRAEVVAPEPAGK